MLFRLRSGGAKGPGLFFVLPCIDAYRCPHHHGDHDDYHHHHLFHHDHDDHQVCGSADRGL